MAFSTQQAIDIAGIKDGVAILKNGGFRLVLQVSSLNFDLKSEQEQNNLIFQYQSFLNSLHFPIQVIIRSKRLDLTPYLEMVKKKAQTQVNELIKIQTVDYVDFVSKLISLANIMKKTFYVIIPFDPISIKHINIFDRLFKKSEIYDHLRIGEAEFKSHVDTLKERANIVATGLGSMGLHCFQLSTEDLIELFYSIYNPDEAAKERLKDAESLVSPVVIAESEATTKEKAKKEEKSAMIDNSHVVEQQRKQEAQLRKQELNKEAEKTPAPAKQQPVPPPANQQSQATPTQQAPVQPVSNQAQAPSQSQAPAQPSAPALVQNQPQPVAPNPAQPQQ